MKYFGEGRFALLIFLHQSTKVRTNKYQNQEIGCSTLMQEDSQSESDCFKVPKIQSINFNIYVIVIGCRPKGPNMRPPWLRHGQAKLV